MPLLAIGAVHYDIVDESAKAIIRDYAREGD